MAQVLETATGRTQNFQRAANIYMELCEDKNGEACARLASMYERGAGVFRSREMARQYRKKACSAGVTDSCDKPDPAKPAASKS
jgi:TPR repeat protein